MTLQRCHECGQTISSKADLCPNCGYSFKRDREWTVQVIIWIVMLIAVLIGVVMCIGVVRWILL